MGGVDAFPATLKRQFGGENFGKLVLNLTVLQAERALKWRGCWDDRPLLVANKVIMTLTRHAAPRRRLLLGGLSLAVLCLASPMAARAQATPQSSAPPAYRRRTRDIGSLLVTGVVVIGGLLGWAAWSAKRKRKKEEAAREMQLRLARARERSKNL